MVTSTLVTSGAINMDATLSSKEWPESNFCVVFLLSGVLVDWFPGVCD